ncbi:hypothetical protein [Marinimicrobium sp. ABcell2]|uniref:hypothetical protein n=1 Tax=Marinimicrobium sp. ABcell2 TaxID=3069751 RepID=UPI0027B5A502|nr:hypothetical protein [Marinimicrobium sp. ABcell2]MDQ2075511.1 hypothetical protein [Marinimicrobium sp. ABcell2]
MRLAMFVLASLSLFIATTVTADTNEAPRFVCTSGDSERVIEVVYRNPERTLPCEVRYHKDGESETLWRAQNEPGFCESQAERFASDQEQWGWECEPSNDTDTVPSESTTHHYH